MGSKRHAKFMELQRDFRRNQQPQELVHAIDVRWTSRSVSSEKVLTLFNIILKCLEHFQADKDVHTRTTSIGLYHQLSNKQFLFLLITFNRIFQATEQATRALQKQDLTADIAIDLIETCKETLKNFRNDDKLGYEQTVKLTNERAAECEIKATTFRPHRKKKLLYDYNRQSWRKLAAEKMLTSEGSGTLYWTASLGSWNHALEMCKMNFYHPFRHASLNLQHLWIQKSCSEPASFLMLSWMSHILPHLRNLFKGKYPKRRRISPV